MRHSPVRTWLMRIMLGLLVVAVTAGASLAVYEYFDYFRHTSYVFVGIFLLLIVLSNLLARLADSFINT